MKQIEFLQILLCRFLISVASISHHLYNIFHYSGEACFADVICIDDCVTYSWSFVDLHDLMLNVRIISMLNLKKQLDYILRYFILSLIQRTKKNNHFILIFIFVSIFILFPFFVSTSIFILPFITVITFFFHYYL